MGSRGPRFNVAFQRDERAMLGELATLHYTSAGQVVRALVRWAHKMEIEGDRMCVDGSRCDFDLLHPGGSEGAALDDGE